MTPATHCRRGHLYDEFNTYYQRGGQGRGCKECQRAARLRSGQLKSLTRKPKNVHVAIRLATRLRFEGDCWVVMGGAFDKDGYGVVTRNPDTRSRRAHRVAWELWNGPIPRGLVVCHRCDNPPCCNPFHLFLGTVADNNRDRGIKGRGAPQAGSSNPRAILTEENVAEMRRRYADGTATDVLAREFNISSRRYVADIVAGRRWRHVA